MCKNFDAFCSFSSHFMLQSSFVQKNIFSQQFSVVVAAATAAFLPFDIIIIAVV
jgi:hypothetical protein